MPDPLPLYLNVDGAYQAREMALPFADLIGEGVLKAASPGVAPPAGVDPLLVGPTGPVSMGISIGAGAAWVRNDGANDAAAYYDGGAWRVSRPTALQLPISAAHASLARIDRVVLEVLDSQFGGASDLGRVRVIDGTPGSSPAIPAEPRSALTLAQVNVGAGVTSIGAGNIVDLRPVAKIGTGSRATTAPPILPTYKNNPGVLVTNNFGQAAAAGANTMLSFNTLLRDQQLGFGMYGPATPWTLYGAAPGLHFFHFLVRWGVDGGDAGTHRTIEVQKSGPGVPATVPMLVVARDTRQPQSNMGSTEPSFNAISGLVYLDMVNYSWLNFFIRHNAGSARSAVYVADISPIASLVYLGPTLLT